ncbi:Glycine-zipper containing OmpA-like membrane domain-containing protein [Nitrosomonas sp. Nm51]|uniref:glycine zipper family protein n=1 Tax=Nitrosomonas sp. Nm51 TaxID=133720 RepID=UPI0008B5DBCE|nr:glycine zipper family protein [Nitrosomonas sp. Nm51]SER71370.1 Glycine-zipper containing OmpA-like membrane domain-containing protein [Nitrosomonas sp. Nm51]
MKSRLAQIALLATVLMLTACVNMPAGPSVMVLPGSGISFDQFRHDDYECKLYAYEQLGGKTAGDAAIGSGLNTAAIGAGLGAIAGAAFGGGRGAAIGAGTGLLAGGLSGSGTATTSAHINQQRYDNSYIQCMYAKGHHVPIAGNIRNQASPYNSGKSKKISAPPPPPDYPSPYRY